MNWQETRRHFPHQWLVVEALQAHSCNNQRILDDIAVIQTFEDSLTAWRTYAKLHRQSPQNEFYVLHTDREILEIEERYWLGIRDAA
jgi:hypothetical protein